MINGSYCSFPQWNEFTESNISLYRDQFKEPVCLMCLDVYAVTSWSLIKEVAGSKHFVIEFQ